MVLAATLGAAACFIALGRGKALITSSSTGDDMDTLRAHVERLMEEVDRLSARDTSRRWPPVAKVHLNSTPVTRANTALPIERPQ
jgi:hypothetical protein